MSNTSPTNIPRPKVIIDRMALEKIRHFVNKDSQECSGMGITRVVGDTIYIDEIQMLEQKNGAAHTDINEDAVTKLMFDWREKPGQINFWWHSHVNMSVFWSGTDEQTIRQLAQHGMCIASVFNKKGEIRTAVACKIQLPFAEGPQIVMFDEIPLLAQTKIANDIREEWDKEHTASVRKYPVVYTGGERGPRLSDDDWTGDGGFWTGHGRGGNGATHFKPVTTKHPDYWDSMSQGHEYDTDWVYGSVYRDQKYTKSDLYKKQYAAWVESEIQRQAKDRAAKLVGGNGNGEPSLVGFSEEEKRRLKAASVDSRTKYAYAMAHDEITDYIEETDKFELFNGCMMNASWYMSDGCAAFRIKTKELFMRAMKLEQERLKLLARNEGGNDRATQLELDSKDVALQVEVDSSAKELNEDLKAMEADGAPNPNTFTEEDVEKLYASVSGR